MIFPPTILLVDDDIIHLKTMRHIFKNLPWIIDLASSGEEAVERLQEKDYDIVISDLHMTLVNGIDVMKVALKECPESVRIILSGDEVKDTVLDAINAGHIWQYIPKPWRADEFLYNVKNAVEITNTRKKQKNLLAEIEAKNRVSQELNISLEARNLELKTLNENLESLVFDRTRELKVHADALRLLAEKDDCHGALNLLLAFLREEFGTSNIHLGAESLSAPNMSCTLHYSHETIGYLNIKDMRRLFDKKLQDILERSLPLVELCSSHNHAKNTTVSADRIDEFLEHL